MEITIVSPLWLLLPWVVALSLMLVPFSNGLPGTWKRQIDRPLADFLAIGVGQKRSSGTIVLLALWSLLCAGLASISFGDAAGPQLRNTIGRVLVLDMASAASDASLIIHAQALLEADRETPVGIVAVTEEPFEVVPLTTDRQFLQRYLTVLKEDVLPLDGRNPAAGIALAEQMFKRADVVVGQIVILTASDGRSVAAATSGASDRWLLVVDPGLRDSWREFSQTATAPLASEFRIETITAALDRAHRELVASAGTVSQRRRLSWWFIVLSLPLWLWLFFRRAVD